MSLCMCCISSLHAPYQNCTLNSSPIINISDRVVQTCNNHTSSFTFATHSSGTCINSLVLSEIVKHIKEYSITQSCQHQLEERWNTSRPCTNSLIELCCSSQALSFSQPNCTDAPKIGLFKHSTENMSINLDTKTASKAKKKPFQKSVSTIAIAVVVLYQCALPGPRIWTNITRRPSRD